MNYKDWIGQDALDETGDKVGTIDQLYVDGDTNEPTWATIKSGLFGTKTHFVPLALAEPGEDGINFRTTAAAIQEAPGIEVDQELSPHDQAVLYKHYRQQQADEGEEDNADETGGDETAADEAANQEDDRDDGVPSTVTGVSRSGDDADSSASDGDRPVGNTGGSGGRVRLRKYVITEIVTDGE